MFGNDMPGVKRFPHIFEPRRIGTMVAPNSVKYAACSVSNFNTRDGHVTEREMGRMRVIAKTGAGMITNQGAYPDKEGLGKSYFRQLCLADDSYIPALARIADLIHEGGAIAIQQVLHGGRYGGIDTDHCHQASDVPQTLRHFRPPRTMPKDGIRTCIREHADAARRCMTAGYDGVELTAFMGYLLANFLSPFTNNRTDEYGGSVENRGRFMRELIGEIKETIGDKILWIRLNGEELLDDQGGSTPDECLEYMKMAEAAGVDGISIVVGWHESRKGALGRDLPTTRWLYLAERAKSVLTIPVAFGPRFGAPAMADAAIADGKMDFWEVCRPFLADPLLLHKVAEDRIPEITPCLGGLTCLARMFRNLPYICTVNPRLGHEYEPTYQVREAPLAKKVLVIGGGPGGMVCALAAAAKGHSVSLYEQRPALGGQARTAALEVQAGREAYLQLLSSYEARLAAAGVEVVLGTKVNRALVEGLAPDVTVVATGARIARSELEGSDLPFVVYGDWTDPGDIPPGDRVVIVGVERAGLVLAERLADQGRSVSVVGPGRVAGDVIPTFKWRHRAWLEEYGITAYGKASVERITPEGVHFVDERGEKQLLPADLVVLSGPRKNENALVTELQFSSDELYAVGDAVTPRNLAAAIHEGFRVGNSI